ncbi:SNF2 domain-containing protein ENL1-like isoform X1 [Oryza sativa Japonica Group]|uniref:DNA repair helicase ERCC6-like n=3 Tax=Oryza sativa subsp. japonica TaxID=39947 RepID=A0A0P0V5M9_ORYSJ|nr:protein CHROMATIN REMODELING 24 isoform X1 [Oryza sativa Japonica Group]BAD68933.1 DNA repair helicase ERCC6-like [Oryza sativa Japonica Group]BAF05581.1 Os01g0636700 [Oryza sativa Japonica Group]BAS73340.1 Os01g0636700 [Oryza sativa Japonica Group]|eukprot:NP_001043667.1 Os01g0636700 [Oryza sativa Japonica Group]
MVQIKELGEGSSHAGQVVIRGLPSELSYADLADYFIKYGKIVDLIIIRAKGTAQAGDSAKITYADAAISDKIIKCRHIIKGKHVVVDRTLMEDTIQYKDKKTNRRITLDGLPWTVSNDDIVHFFSPYGTVVDHQITQKDENKLSEGSGFVLFSSELAVIKILSNGNTVNLGGEKVSINRSGAFVIAATGHHIKHPFLLPSEIFSSLFPHQKDGLEWLWRLHCEKSGGGILADDMGLGKTRQASAFLAGLFYSDLTQRVLIVAPGTILHQWIAELTKVGFNEDLIHSFWCAKTRHDSLAQVLKEGGVLLITYDLVRLYNEELNGMSSKSSKMRRACPSWDYVILDEGHVLKNPNTKNAAALKSLSRGQTVVLTGTPVQNNLSEFHSLMSLCCPTVLGSLAAFERDFCKPIDMGNVLEATTEVVMISSKKAMEFRKMVRPYFLRRTKESIESLLPNKADLVIWLKLTPYQI